MCHKMKCKQNLEDLVRNFMKDTRWKQTCQLNSHCVIPFKNRSQGKETDEAWGWTLQGERKENEERDRCTLSYSKYVKVNPLIVCISNVCSKQLFLSENNYILTYTVLMVRRANPSYPHTDIELLSHWGYTLYNPITEAVKLRLVE